MTLHLNANGSLTQNQKDEATRLAINHMDYRLHVLKQINDHYEKIINETNDIVTITSSNPYIVIGAGPNWEKEVSKIIGTDIPVISADKCAKPLFELGIIPKYIVTFEESPKYVKDAFFPYEKIKEYNISVIGSPLTRIWLDESLKKIGHRLERFSDYEGLYCGNVGMFGAMFARYGLKADKIILFGMNCWDRDVPLKGINWNWINKIPPYLDWYTHWRPFQHKNRGVIVNCSQGGLLYGNGVIMADFAKLEIKNG